MQLGKYRDQVLTDYLDHRKDLEHVLEQQDFFKHGDP